MSCDTVINNSSITRVNSIVNNDEADRDDSIDVSDASTILNISLFKKDNGMNKYEIENNLDDVSICSEVSSHYAESIQSTSVEQKHKVGWLEEEPSSFEVFIPDRWLDSELLSKHIRRTRVFLLDFEPNPENEPLDLVSGYCYNGCKRFFVYTTICWTHQDDLEIPVCHECAKKDLEKELQLVFKFVMKVIDTTGVHRDVTVWRDQGEELFGCSLLDFIFDRSLREAAVTSLTSSTIDNTGYESYTPVFDMNLVSIRNHLFVVNTRLIQRNKSRSIRDIRFSSTDD